mmetsp:Transcript_96977/g.313320  ORF Transcript_96977/g.313320 Transcript_96977/m.313320 type:complete len:229 (-) Transcript_96977:321-1007(-)
MPQAIDSLGPQSSRLWKSTAACLHREERHEGSWRITEEQTGLTRGSNDCRFPAHNSSVSRNKPPRFQRANLRGRSTRLGLATRYWPRRRGSQPRAGTDDAVTDDDATTNRVRHVATRRREGRILTTLDHVSKFLQGCERLVEAGSQSRIAGGCKALTLWHSVGTSHLLTELVLIGTANVVSSYYASFPQGGERLDISGYTRGNCVEDVQTGKGVRSESSRTRHKGATL